MGAIYPDLEGKTVLVTGGAGEIGAGAVRELARQHAQVAFIDIAVEPARVLVHELERQGQNVRFEPCDLADVPALQRTIAAVRNRLGPIQILVNTAADSSAGHATDTLTEADWNRLIAVNLKQQLFCCQAVMADMKAARAGAIVNLGSLAWMSGEEGSAAQGAAQAAVLGLTRSLARELGPAGIRVNAVAPGWSRSERGAPTPDEAAILARQCLKRRLSPLEIARFIVFLASDEASACTGQCYVVDGGYV
jgi:NAD(P)-dependent dehydrogenase (short-subunit alcohol dehydrogenase family)